MSRILSRAGAFWIFLLCLMVLTVLEIVRLGACVDNPFSFAVVPFSFFFVGFKHMYHATLEALIFFGGVAAIVCGAVWEALDSLVPSIPFSLCDSQSTCFKKRIIKMVLAVTIGAFYFSCSFLAIFYYEEGLPSHVVLGVLLYLLGLIPLIFAVAFGSSFLSLLCSNRRLARWFTVAVKAGFVVIAGAMYLLCVSLSFHYDGFLLYFMGIFFYVLCLIPVLSFAVFDAIPSLVALVWRGAEAERVRSVLRCAVWIVASAFTIVTGVGALFVSRMYAIGVVCTVVGLVMLFAVLITAGDRRTYDRERETSGANQKA